MSINDVELEDEVTKRIKATPDSVQDFIDNIDLPNEFVVELKRLKGPDKGIIREFKMHEIQESEFDPVGEEYGPGAYQWFIKWRNPETNRKQGKSFNRVLAPDHYQELWESNQRSKQKRADTLNGKTQDNPINPLEFAQGNYDLALKMANQMKSPYPPPTTSNSLDTPALISMMQENSKNMMTMMMEGNKMMMGLFSAVISNMGQNNNQNQGDGMFDKIMKGFLTLSEVKQAITPGEKQSTVQQIVGTVAENLPTILNLVAMKVEERDKNYTYRAIKNSSQIKELDADPELKKQVVEQVAEKIGLEDTQSVLQVLGWHEFDEEIGSAIEKQQSIKTQSVPEKTEEAQEAPEEISQ